MTLPDRWPSDPEIQDRSGYFEDMRPTPQPFERLERMARKIGRAVRRLAANDRDMQADLTEVTAKLTGLIGEAQQWRTLHHLLYAVQVSADLFRGDLQPEGEAFNSVERQALLQNWRTCQERLDALADFAERASALGSPFQQNRFELRGERWAVEPIALRLLVEDALKEEQPNPRSLQEIMADFVDTCFRHMETADRGLQESLSQLQRLLVGLLDELR